MGDTQPQRSWLRRWWLITVSISVLWTHALFHPAHSLAQSCDDIACSQSTQDEDTYLSCIKQKQACLEQKIDETKQSQGTLSNTISILNGQIQVQELSIQQTLTEIHKLEREIDDLTQRIGGLDLSLDQLTRLMVRRVDAQYKRQYVNPISLFFSNNSLSSFLIEYKYLKVARAQTVDAMQRAETQRQVYDDQKTLKEQKQTEVAAKQKQLEQQQAQLEQQRADQQFLLQQTKNNEAKYQQQLAETLQELAAIQSIIAGKGTETPVRDVKAGDTIASIIPSSSPCSTGAHLHFEMTKDGSNRDPAGYLKPIGGIIWNNQPDGPFDFTGNWDWPLHDPARINQGYGMTYYARVMRSYGGAPHTGIDMISKSSGDYTVLAVKDGTLYRGSISCGGGLLRYVKVTHKDDASISSYYLHVNY